jgi:hypothetical protein
MRHPWLLPDDDLACLLVEFDVMVGLIVSAKWKGRDPHLESVIGEAVKDVFAGGEGEAGIGVIFRP